MNPWPSSLDPGEWEDEDSPEPPCLEVDINEPQIIGRFVDVNGDDLLTIYDRDTVDFGFQPTGED